jgi:hypothetical protein
MDNDVTWKAIFNGIAEGMEKEAGNITAEQQRIRDKIQPLGRIISEEVQESLNSVSESALGYVSHLRETAASLRKAALDLEL